MKAILKDRDRVIADSDVSSEIENMIALSASRNSSAPDESM